MTNSIGPLTPADEGFHHQIVDTFATVGSSDLAWTEKVCAMAVARDGSLQLGFGLGKYPNRNVMDGYAGTSRGAEQRTVRACRRLFPDADTTVIGPIRYDVVEPMRVVRFRLDANEVQPIAFDWTFTTALPAQLEDRTFSRNPSRARVASDIVRYHQIGTAAGWVEVDGERTEMYDDTWVSTRDHSWGVRYDVGQAPTDVEQLDPLAFLDFRMLWSPILCERPDGSRYGIFLHLQHMEGFGFRNHVVMGGWEHPDGRVEPVAELVPELRWDAVNRRLLGGRLHATMADGSVRTLAVTVPADTGFHLGAGLYFGYRGHHHGEWRGELHVEGERIADCRLPDAARELHQIRDTFVIVDDPSQGGRGYGNCQPMMVGEFPEHGLTRADSFL
ncbi:MAG: hypothetical protein U0V73_10195 [Acidimicrobiia bacterium]